MVTIKFRSFQEYKDYITNLGTANPNRAAPYRFHTVVGQSADKIAEIFAGGTVVLLYDSPSNEIVPPADDWFKSNKSMNYPASVIVADITEAM